MSSNASTMNYPANDSMARLIALENRTGYTMQQFNGQRKYWNPKWKDPIPPRGCEVFVGKIPRDLFEDELVPVFEKANDTLSRIKNVYVRNLKIQTSHYTIFSAFNAIRPGAIERVKKIEDRDYAFVHFLRREDALYAVQVMNGQIIDGQAVQVSLAKPPSNKRDVKTPVPVVRANQITSAKLPTFTQMNGLLVSKPNPVVPLVNAIPTLSSNAPKPLTSLMTNPIQPSMLTPGQNTLKPAQLTSVLSVPNLYQAQATSADQNFGADKQPTPVVPSMNDIVNEFKKIWLMGNNQNGKSNLEPVCTLDHIAKIQCPVVYLDQLCAMFNNGVRPLYKLYCDESFGITRYVYQVTLMNKTYLPPSNMFSTSIAEAQKNSARYILAQLDPWLKLKFLEVVNGNKCIGQVQSKPSEVVTPNTGLVKSVSHPDGLNQYAMNDVGWKTLNPVTQSGVSDNKSGLSNNDSSWKQWIEMNLPPARPPVVTSAIGMSMIPRHSYSSVSTNKENSTSTSSLGLSDGLWDRLPAPETSSAAMQNGTTRSAAPDTSSLLASALGSSCFSDFKRHPSSAFECVMTSANF
uniref:CUGBP Elav-like family member 3-B n=1 Tax=Phallusia mammillata TaxID=59560 RepID=A0A6F9DQM6_9ASCI|nr:CUGBP Elav-like family member 3-B [Phallusia mammillata]